MKKKAIQNIVKLIITGTALYYVFQKIDTHELLSNITKIRVVPYLLAILAFNVSKTFSAFRMLNLYNTIGLRLSKVFNWKLYYVGMFYNLFLPGSIGGDGYKVYLLKQMKRKEVSTKRLVEASFLDRSSGLALLFLLGGIFLLLSSFDINLPYLDIIIIVLIVATLPLFYLFVNILFKSFLPAFWKMTWYSVAVQVGQVLTAGMLLYALSIHAGYMDYLMLFMVSSIVTVVPLTVGGVGMRELVFLYGYQFLNIEKDKAITFTLLFFSVTAISALFGLLASFRLKEEKQKNNTLGQLNNAKN